MSGAGGVGSGGLQSFEGLGATDLAQGSGGSRLHLDIVIRQQRGQDRHGPRLVPESKRADDADSCQPGRLRQGIG